MGMTLWIHSLVGRRTDRIRSDYTLMHDLAGELDELAEQLKIEPLTAFFDFTDFTYRLSAPDEEDEKLDPETGWPYGIDQMNWFELKAGLKALQALLKHLHANPTALAIEAEERDSLLREMEDCEKQLKSLSKAPQVKFHFAVIL